MKKFISTTLPYINSKPHIGHAFEFILADLIVRSERFLGNEVFFNVGIDEHGLKIQNAAKGLQKSPLEFCNELFIVWKEFAEKFNISYDNFFRTSAESHHNYVLRLFEKLYKEGKIYKEEYSGFYCEGCEAYVTKKEMLEGNICPNHLKELFLTTQENYFIKLTKTENKEILFSKLLEKELENNFQEFDKFSITRKNIDWGVKISNEDTIYVWFEALLNYIESIQNARPEDWEEYWENSIIICGRDNLKFQAYILPSLLKSCDLPENNKVIVHGMILDKHRRKMSKSLNNVLDPIYLLNNAIVDANSFRLFFASKNFEQDIDYNVEIVSSVWENFAINGFGNLLARTYHIGKIKNVDWAKKKKFESKLKTFLSDYKFHEAYEYCQKLIIEANSLIESRKPYIKESSPENTLEVLSFCDHCLEEVGAYLSIVAPEISEKIKNAIIAKEKIILFEKK